MRSLSIRKNLQPYYRRLPHLTPWLQRARHKDAEPLKSDVGIDAVAAFVSAMP